MRSNPCSGLLSLGSASNFQSPTAPRRIASDLMARSRVESGSGSPNFS